MIIVSVFRNSAEYLERYVNQIKALREHVPVKVVCAEGDSTDDTFLSLIGQTDYKVLKVEHGGPTYTSQNVTARWRQLASVCNVALTAGVRELGADEPLCYVESDLVWEPDVLVRLAEHVTRYPAVSPMSMRPDTAHHLGKFYDVWGYTKNWQQFAHHAPYFDGWSETMMHQITSSGSCVMLSSSAAPLVHFDPADCIKGIGRRLAAANMTLWLDPTLKVVHP